MSMVRHGGFTRVSLVLDNAGGPLADMERCAHRVQRLIKQNDMKIVGESLIPNGTGEVGYIVVFVLEESKVIIEAWPEICRVKVIVDLCHFTRNNRKRALKIAAGIKKLFGAKNLLCAEEIREDDGVLINKKVLERRLAKYAPASRRP